MPIVEITHQPAEAINSAYRPIIFRCKAKTGNLTSYAPPVVYCDVYVNSVYYKTLAKTQFIANDGVAPEYQFDIQDAMQELMTYEIPAADGDKVETFFGGVKNVFVRFRNAIIDADNFTVSEQVSPVMATSSSPAQSGAGTQSAKIIVTNTLIQHEENMSLTTLLNSYKTGMWDENTFPLTRRPEQHLLGPEDSSHFPILTDKTIKTLCLVYNTYFATATFCVEAEVVNDEAGGGGGSGGGGEEEGSPPLVFIKWLDTNTNEDRVCTTGDCPFTIDVDKTDPDDDIVTAEVLKSTDGGTTWTSFIPDMGITTNFSDAIDSVGNQWYKVKVTDSEDNVKESNILKYSISVPTYPTYNFWFAAVNPEGHPGVDSVVYLNDFGDEMELILQRAYEDEYGTYPAPCTLISASSIVSTTGAISCTP